MRSQFHLSAFALALGFALTLPVSAQDAKPAAAEKADEAEQDYIRFTETPPGAQLETAIVSYTHPDGAKLDLIGVIHIGDQSYYEKLNERFKAYDALLYEMVGSDPGEPLTKEMLQAKKNNPLRFFQLLTAGMLDLKFQLDHIDYTAGNFVHADMDMETFQRRQAEKGENLLSLIEEGAEAQEKQGGGSFDFNEMFGLFTSDSTPDGNKMTLGRQFHHIEGMLGGMGGDEGSVLVGERNETALKVMKREIAAGKKSLALFYGAAHLPDFDRKLREVHGFVRGESDWLAAWEINADAAEPAGDVEDAPVPAEEKKAA